MKLIPLSEYVEKQTRTSTLDTSQIDWYDKEIEKLEKIRSYTKFLRQPLTLSMFVPCFDDGYAFDLPLIKFFDKEFDEEQERLLEKAKEKVLFEGFGLHSINSAFNADMGLTIDLDTFQFMVEDSLGVGGGDIWGKTLEALANTDLQLPLTPSALKLIGEKE